MLLWSGIDGTNDQERLPQTKNEAMCALFN